MIQLITSIMLFTVVSFSTIETSSNENESKKTTRILKRLDDGQPLVE